MCALVCVVNLTSQTKPSLFSGSQNNLMQYIPPIALYLQKIQHNEAHKRSNCSSSLVSLTSCIVDIPKCELIQLSLKTQKAFHCSQNSLQVCKVPLTETILQLALYGLKAGRECQTIQSIRPGRGLLFYVRNQSSGN